MPFNIRPVVAADEPFSALLYGLSGAGKTSMAVTISRHPKVTKALVINTDQGLAAIPAGTAVSAVDATDAKVLFELVNALTRETRDQQLRDINTVILDSLSATRFSLLHQINEEGSFRKGQRSPTFRFPELQEYGALTFAMDGILQRLQASRLNLVYTCGATDIRHPETGAVIKTVYNMTPSLANLVTFRCSHIIGLRAVNARYYMCLTPYATKKYPFEVIKARNPSVVAQLNALTGDTGIMEVSLGEDGLPSFGLDDVYNLYEDK